MAKLYYSTYICQLWLWDSKHMSDKAIKGLNPALISIAKNISNTSSWSSLRLIWNCKRNLKVSIMIPSTMRPSAAWGSGGGLSPEGVWRDIFELLAKAGSQGLAWAPCPGKPHSGPHSPELPVEDLPTLEAQDGPPPKAPGCWGPQSGRNDQWNFEFHPYFQFDFKELHDEVLEIFFAGDIKKTVSP